MLAAAIGAGAVLGACDWGPPDDVIYVPASLRIEVLEGADVTDTVEARVPIRVQLVIPDDETTAPLRLPVTFSVPAEGCGDPFLAVVTSDDHNQAAGGWVLGQERQTCLMEIRVLANNGTRLGFVAVESTVEAGQAVEGWLDPGQLLRAVDTVAVTLGDVQVFDRFSNDVAWRFEVVSGPAVVLGQELDDDRSRTLVATGEGSGTLDVVTKFGAFLRAGFDICTSGGERWVRVFRQEDAATVLAACP